jgi:hypothetical protein
MKNFFASVGAVATLLSCLFLAAILIRSSCVSHYVTFREESPDGKLYVFVRLRDSGPAVGSYREVFLGRTDSDEIVQVVGIQHCNGIRVRWLDDRNLEVRIEGAIALDWLDNLFRNCLGVREVRVRYVLI